MERKNRDKDRSEAMEMNLNDEPFFQIRDGIKTIEVRLFDEKRQRIRVGDTILFLRKNRPEERILTRVIGLHRYPTFAELFSPEHLEKAGFAGYSVSEAVETMRGFYSEKEEKKYGVLGIEVSFVDE